MVRPFCIIRTTEIPRGGGVSQIKPVGDNIAASNFGSNTWGYNLSITTDTTAGPKSLSYSTVPGSETAVINKTEEQVTASGDYADRYDLTFGTKIDNGLPDGHYENKILLSAVANPPIISSLTDATYMQDMTAKACQNTAMSATKTLIDSRDGKSYTVSRLADGNCWMTQDLAFEIDATKGLSAADSDINAPNTEWTAANPGVDTDGNPKVAPSTTLNGDCDTKVETYNSATATGSCHFTPYWDSSKEHYFYQWNTVTAGSGGNIENKMARDSICPKGWRLPDSGNDTESGTFGYLSASGGSIEGYPGVRFGGGSFASGGGGWFTYIWSGRASSSPKAYSDYSWGVNDDYGTNHSEANGRNNAFVTYCLVR